MTKSLEQRRAQGTTHMHVPLTPVGAGSEQATALRLQGGEVYTQPGKCVGTPIEKIEAMWCPFNVFKPHQSLRKFDAETPG